MNVFRTMTVSVTALALATTLGGTATARSPGQSPATTTTEVASIAPSAKTCFSNLDGDTGVAQVSQNFAAPDDANDSAGADDFTLERKCRLKMVTAIGQYFIGGGDADVTVTVYRDRDGKPGKVRMAQTVAGDATDGSFQLPLETVKLKRGTYWLSVVPKLDWAGGDGSMWGWETTSDVEGRAALWRNPKDGFATGCTAWADMQKCIGGGRGGDDFMFALN